MKIILASQSPRRKQILSEYIQDFEVCPSSFDESQIVEVVPYLFAEKAAKSKAFDLARSKPEDLLVSGDTIVVYKDIILGKPKDIDEARDTLRMLSGKKHQVISGLCLYCKEKGICLLEHEITDVCFNELADQDIENYLSQGTYRDKAGSYAIQDIGDIFVNHLEGDYNNVVGFPLELFKKMFAKYQSLSKGEGCL